MIYETHNMQSHDGLKALAVAVFEQAVADLGSEHLATAADARKFLFETFWKAREHWNEILGLEREKVLPYLRRAREQAERERDRRSVLKRERAQRKAEKYREALARAEQAQPPSVIYL